MKRALAFALVAASIATSPIGTVGASGPEVIEATIGTPVMMGTTAGQTFLPTTSGQITEVTIWTDNTPQGSDRMSIYGGDGLATQLASVSFDWNSSMEVVALSEPIRVVAGRTYLIRPSERGMGTVLMSTTDPYAGGEVALWNGERWIPRSELARCLPGDAGCSPYHFDFHFRIVVGNSDADGDGVSDDSDLCAGTVLPDEPTRGLGTKRYAATFDGFAGTDGVIVRTLADTGGCSAFQIIEAGGLGDGHKKFGITRPHLDMWVAIVAIRAELG